MVTSGNRCNFSIRFKDVLENKELFNVILGNWYLLDLIFLFSFQLQGQRPLTNMG